MFDQCISNVERANCGIPQESVLRSVLFNIYINDIANTSDKFKYILFVDDTSILNCSDREDNVFVMVNQELKCLHKWLCVNTLSINLEKTNYLVSKKRKIPVYFDIYIDSHIITKTSSVKFVGVYMDKNLNWKTQIDFVSSKLRKVSFMIFKTSNTLNNTSLKILYYSLFYPHLDYWSGATHTIVMLKV